MRGGWAVWARTKCVQARPDCTPTPPEGTGIQIPTLLTPGAAETLAVKVYRMVRTQKIGAPEALAAALRDYQNPVPADVLRFQIELAVREASDLDFVAPIFREYVREDRGERRA